MSDERWYIKLDTLTAIKQAILTVEGKSTSNPMFVNTFASRIAALPTSSTLTETVYFDESPATNTSLSSYFSQTSIADMRENLVYLRTGFAPTNVYSAAASSSGGIQEYTTKGNRKFVCIDLAPASDLSDHINGGYLCFWRAPFTTNDVTRYGFYCKDYTERDSVINSNTFYGNYQITNLSQSNEADHCIVVIRK